MDNHDSSTERGSDLEQCPGCGTPLPSVAIFCPMCLTQARCKACSYMLLVDARGCIRCGTRIDVATPSVPDVDRLPESPILNSFEYVETAQRRELHAKLTDSTVESLSGAFTAFFGGRAASPSPGRRVAARPVGEGVQALPPPGEVIDVEDGFIIDSSPQEALARPLDGSRLSTASLDVIFSEEGGKLRLDQPDLKARGKRDHAERLTCLFLLAHALRGRTEVERSQLNEVLDDAQVYDGNYRTWIVSNNFVRQTGDNVRLLLPGRQRALAILEEMADASAEAAFLPGMKRRSPRAKSSSADASPIEEASGRRVTRSGGVSRSKQADQWLTAWKELGLSRDCHAAMEGKSNWEKGLLGLWAIRRATTDQVKEVSRVSLSAFLWAAFEIKVHERTLAAALESTSAKGKVEKVKGTNYQALPPGMAHIEQILGVTPDARSGQAKGKK